jgi:6-pyruvoyltetrahydropterin/6-carboxytetrahydropterin synthase
MSDTALADAPHIATLHRDDAPFGRTARFHLRKVFDNLPCCHRSWANHGTRFFLLDYERTFEIEFACAETEPGTGLVLDPTALKQVLAALRRQFDHTTLIALDDPDRELFELLADRGVIDLRIMNNTGIEGSAAWVFDTVDSVVGRATRGRVWVSRIEVRESDGDGVTLAVRPAGIPD